MGHNSVVSGHLKSTGIPRVDGLSMGPQSLRLHNYSFEVLGEKTMLIIMIIPP